MKKIVLPGIALVMSFLAVTLPVPVNWQADAHAATFARSDGSVEQAFKRRQSSVQVQGSGRVIRLLPDDNKGKRHQRFIVRVLSGQTVLVAHNIDLAKRVARLSPGDEIEFSGEYEWNRRGGVVHWTHHDPHRRHADGWIKHRGILYR